MYFDSGCKWQYNPKGECFVCSKYRYFMLFLDLNEPITELKEILDTDLIEQVREDLNLNHREEMDEIAPIVCGTIVGGY